MNQKELFPKLADHATESPIRRGPPNRMNDLDYSTWMKFQKSFFWHESSQALVDECVYFFTKSVWPDGKPSRSLILGFRDYTSKIPAPRQIETSTADDVTQIMQRLLQAVENNVCYDFILVDLRHCVATSDELTQFLAEYSDKMFRALRQLLQSDRFCGVIVGTGEKGGSGFPIPWSIGNSSRKYLKLKDEKIGLVEASEQIFYCLFMQAQDDEFPAKPINPDTIKWATADFHIPAWILPKSPPRKKNEILHPAKYPETLVTPFIELFTKPGQTVFDPMVGTGSTVIAAIRCDRNGYGVDLMQDFVDIAKERVVGEKQPMLLAEFESKAEGVILCGDSTHLDENTELAGKEFHYAITSPPYWSMLNNPGSENQEARRQKQLQLVYSDSDGDLGNVSNYQVFLVLLKNVYHQVANKLVPGGYLTVVVKNVKREHTVYTLAWDIVEHLCGSDGRYEYLGTTLWCQDDISLKPFAVGTHWVSNTLHNYCLHFRKRETTLVVD